MYANCFKRVMDFALSLFALILLFPLLLVLTIVGAIFMGGNPFFVQPRPGQKGKDGKERIFRLIKFRTMDNRRDERGELLPDDIRLNGYGRFLRSSSLDELPELLNILVGDMAFVGPRPQLVRDMVFMTAEQRMRHSVRPGLTGLAQVNGRNAIQWEEKFRYDLQYIEHITFFGDIKILLQTVHKVFAREGISEEGMATGEDLCDHLLHNRAIGADEYEQKKKEAVKLLESTRV